MSMLPPYCPNTDCIRHLSKTPEAGFFWRKGFFSPKCKGHALVRYQCKACLTTFSNRTFSLDRDHNRPDINRMLSRLMCAGVTLRACAGILECSYNTVWKRALWLAERARAAHDEALSGDDLKTSYIQFDEMQTFEHAAPKALTVALAVRHKTGQILSAKVGRIPANGHLAAIGAKRYGWTVNESPAVCKAALKQAARAAKSQCTVACDGASIYPGIIASEIPHAVIDARPRLVAKDAFDPLFKLNHACAKIRANLAVMSRRTWATTKRRDRLQDKLDVFVAINNGYAFC